MSPLYYRGFQLVEYYVAHPPGLHGGFSIRDNLWSASSATSRLWQPPSTGSTKIIMADEMLAKALS